MKNKKIKSILASALVCATFFTTSIPAYAATTNSDDVKLSDESLNENVLKVDVNDEGQLNYTVPVSNSGLEDKEFSWDNATVYFVMTDRFVNGDKSNDHSYGRGLDGNGKEISGYENKEGYFHGGDLKGLTSKITDGYFTDLGINAIWITAPYEQIHGALTAGGNSPGNGYKHYAYHGYYALDYTEVDKNMGTAEDLENFIDTAHEYGIRVIFDIVLNHAGYANPVDAAEFGYGGLTSNWKEIYYNWNEKQYSWWNDYASISAENGSQGMLVKDSDWETNWWGSKWVRMREGRFSYSNLAPESDGVETCVDGLPDFVTEGTTDPGMPSIMKKKWGSTKLAQEEKELNDFCKNYGMNKCVTTYLVKWLTDWVREYGVDGFRCDTAKHVTIDQWAKVKKAGVQALEEWRENNPDKPGAQWTDEFWVTGECWNHHFEYTDYFKIANFDSMINFDFQGEAGKTGSQLESLFAKYANGINNNDNFNMLNYISSHDTALYARGNLINAGTALLLCPGAAQIYYGDETARQGDGTTGKQPTRSNMNWNSINQGVLSHYQKLGTFRNDHIAIGAGQHNKLGDSPYTFSRTYAKNGIEDKVVVSIPGKSGSVTVPVGDIFQDGETVTDAYTGSTYTVSGGNVSVTAGDNGVVLLEGTGEVRPVVSASVGSTSSTYKFDTETLKVTLNAKLMKNAYYSIDGGEKVAFNDGDVITLGKGLANDETVTLTLSGVDEEGNKVNEKTYEYQKHVVAYEKNHIYAYVDSSWGSNMKVYVYDESSGTAKSIAKWPGVAMEYDKEEGRFDYELPSEWCTENTQIIFTNGSMQYPGSREPGVKFKADTAMVFNGSDVTYKEVGQDEELVAGSISTSEKSPQLVGTEIEITTKEATGGSGSYTYLFEVNGEEIQDYSSSKSATWTPEKAGTYTIKVTVKDSEGNVDFNTVKFVIEDNETEVKITSLETNASNPAYVGNKITITAEAEGEGIIEYRFAVTNEDGEVVKTRSYSESNTAIWTPNEAGTYKITCYAKDENGAQDEKSINLTVDKNEVEELEFVSYKTNPATTKVGSMVKFGSTVKGGTGAIKYRFVVLKDGVAVRVKPYTSANYTQWRPEEAGNYTVVFKAKDSTGKEIKAQTTLVVKEGAPITFKDITTSKASPQKAGTAITINANVTTTNTASYRYWVLDYNGGWTLLKDYSTAKSVTWTPESAGKYAIMVDVKDSKGNNASKFINYEVTEVVNTVQQNNNKLTYTGKWVGTNSENYSANGTRICNTDGSTATFKFTGTGISLIATAAKDRGVAKVTIDGTEYSVDYYSSTTEYQKEVLKVRGLAKGTHTIKIEYTGLKSSKSSGTKIDIDAFNIVGGDIA